MIIKKFIKNTLIYCILFKILFITLDFTGRNMMNIKVKRNIETKPFVKWAGGKRQLLQQFDFLYPARLITGEFDTYVEPFLGGGAVFFELAERFSFDRIILNDINEELIHCYKVIQQKVDNLIKELDILENKYLPASKQERKTMYYEIRKKFNEEKTKIDYDRLDISSIKHAATLIFLNRTCFNGLFRLNSKGEFNVPQGNYKNPKIVDKENLYSVSNILKNVTLLSGDFEKINSYINSNTFVYMDPPYRPLPNTQSFTSYSKQNFNEENQIRLAEFFRNLDRKGASLMLSNSNPSNTDPNDNFFDRYYGNYGYQIIEVTASRAINSNANERGTITELVIINSK